MSDDSLPKQKWPKAVIPFVAMLLLLILIGSPLVSHDTSSQLSAAEEKAIFSVPLGGPIRVMQVRAFTEPARAYNRPYVLSLDQEILVDVRNPEVWLREQMADLDPKKTPGSSGKVTPDPVGANAPAEKQTPSTGGNAPVEKQTPLTGGNAPADKQNTPQTNTAKPQSKHYPSDETADQINATYRALERCCLVINGHVFRDIDAQVLYYWDEHYEIPQDKEAEEEARNADTNGMAYDRYYALRFHVRLTDANKKQWLNLLGDAGFFSRPVGITVAYVSSSEEKTVVNMPSSVNPAAQVEWQKAFLKANSMDFGTWVLCLCVVALMVFVVWEAFSTNVLREQAADGLWHLSLAHCQMAFWFFIVFNCYIFLFIITGDYKTITSQELLLMGISVGTSLGACAITGATAAPASGSQQGSVGNTALQPVVEPELPAAPVEKGWRAVLCRAVNDLICEDNDGKPDFYRIQMIGWTLAFGWIFVQAVYDKLAMPEFTPAQLTLMGISSGTFLGFKYAKKTGDAPSPAVVAPKPTPTPKPL